MILEIFSRRQKRLRGEFPDVYQYEDIPETLRRQIIYIFRDFFARVTAQAFYNEASRYGHELSNSPNQIYRNIIFVLIREYGLAENTYAANQEGVESMILKANTTEKVVAVIELLCQRVKNVELDFLHRA